MHFYLLRIKTLNKKSVLVSNKLAKILFLFSTGKKAKRIYGLIVCGGSSIDMNGSSQ